MEGDEEHPEAFFYLSAAVRDANEAMTSEANYTSSNNNTGNLDNVTVGDGVVVESSPSDITLLVILVFLDIITIVRFF